MKINSLYLAHPFTRRKEVRDLELKFESETGINLANPFYDNNREDIILIDNGLKNPRDFKSEKEAFKIIDRDLRLIRQQDGILAIINKEDFSFGTPMEIFFNYHILKHPGFIVTSNLDVIGHPWIKGSSTDQFENMDQFTKYIIKWNTYA